MNINRWGLIGLVALTLVQACGPFRGRQGPSTATPPAVSIIPAPASLQMLAGAPFALDSGSSIVVEGDGAWPIANALATQLRVPTGFMLNIANATGATPRKGIRLRLEAGRADLGDEGYALLVTTDSVQLTARTAQGLFWGIQSVRQLLPFGIEAENSVLKWGAWTIPALSITDRPRYDWRGSMLDVSRHFFTVDEVKQFIDFLALYKFNVLHLHLGDDQGFRVDIPSHPELVRFGSATQVGGGPGGYYTTDDYKEIVRYAAERFIMIVPEIDMPAHSNAMLISHPQFSCGRIAPAPYTNIHVGFSAICPDSAKAFDLIDDIVRDLAAITPGPYFHMGGDEVEMLNDEQYIRFVERVQQIVNAHGKHLVGWEEIYKARLQPTTIAQQWHTDSVRNVIKYGSKIILSPSNKIYLDMKYTKETELGLDWAGLVEVQTAYDWDPATYIAGVTDANIVGVEAPLWSETIRNIGAAFFMTAPRLPAVAEVAWTPQSRKSWEDFRVRLGTHAPRWRLMGVNYHQSPQVPWH
jgi:hexosaminidase